MTGSKPARKTFHHPQVGTLTLTGQSMMLDGTPGQRLGVYTAEPDTPDHDAMVLLDMAAPKSRGTVDEQPQQSHGRP